MIERGEGKASRGDRRALSERLHELEKRKRLHGVESVVPFLSNEQPARVRMHAASLIGTSGDKSLAQALFPLLDDESEEVRVSAVAALRRLESEATVGVLEECLDDESAVVRYWAIEGLAALRHPRALELARELLRDDRSGPKRVGLRALAAWSEPLTRDEKRELVQAASSWLWRRRIKRALRVQRRTAAGRR